MAIIVFKNGTKLQVPQEVFVVLHGRVLQKEGAKKWQGMMNKKDEPLYLINMDEIVYIEANIGDYDKL